MNFLYVSVISLVHSVLTLYFYPYSLGLPQWHWDKHIIHDKPEEYGQIDKYQITTKYQQVRTVCAIVWTYYTRIISNISGC